MEKHICNFYVTITMCLDTAHNLKMELYLVHKICQNGLQMGLIIC